MAKTKRVKGPNVAESYAHPESELPLRPDVGTQAQFKKKKPPVTYTYDSSLDPQLVWSGKAERLSFDVPTLPLFVHERLSTKAIIETLKGHKRDKFEQAALFDLFADPQHSISDQVLRAYEHRDRWTNRMVLGDSLVVMNSLVHYESLGGQLQMIYMDPPYGVNPGAPGFQPFVRSRRAGMKHNDDEDLTREPEMVQAYRDTWELGLHSYLTYLRDRLLVSRELLAPSGSLFVQISDENLHHVREVMDEVFGAENFCGLVVYQKTGGFSPTLIARNCDFIVWYAKDKAVAKYRQLYEPREMTPDEAVFFEFVELDDGTRRQLTGEERKNPRLIPPSARVLARNPLTSDGPIESLGFEFEFEGTTFKPPANSHWKTTREGMEQLRQENRLIVKGNTLRFVRYLNDFPVQARTCLWTDTGTGGFVGDQKLYVVQTDTRALARCLLMTTDPGDLVLDPTCVRKGTRVWVVDEERGKEQEAAPPQSPRGRGEGQTDDRAEPHNRARTSEDAKTSEDVSGTSALPPSAGGLRGGFLAPSSVRLVPVEAIQPGQLVLSHDGSPHRVLRIIRKRYRGWMVRVQTAASRAPTPTLPVDGEGAKALPPSAGGTEGGLWLTADHRVLAKLRPRTLGGIQDWSGSPIESLDRRRALRQDMSMPERLLWSVLRGKQNGFKFRRQHPFGPYIVDFYCREAHLVVEVDGGSHYTAEAIEYDRRRDRFLRGLGLDVFRVPATEFGDNLEGVAIAVQAQCRLRAESVEGARWVQAGSLVPGDVVFWVGTEEGKTDSAVRQPPLNPPADGGKGNAPADGGKGNAPADGGKAEARSALATTPSHTSSAANLAPSPSAGRVGVGVSSLQAIVIDDIQTEWSEEEVYDLEVEDAHSFLTEVCAVHNCGSGTTAYVAEQWGRRWITIDVSRVPLALARQRLLTATFPWYELADEPRGPAGGFVYRRNQNSKGEVTGGIVPHVTLKSIANNEPPAEEVLVDRPEVAGGITRVTGPFTFEATIPTPTEMEQTSVVSGQLSVAEESTDHGQLRSDRFSDRMLEVLRKSPVLRLEGNKTVTFKNVRPPAKTLSLSAEALVLPSPRPRGDRGGAADVKTQATPSPTLPADGEGAGEPVAFVFGPENGAVSEKLVYEAAREAHAKSYSHLYVIGFAIQPNARSLVDKCSDVVGVAATYVQATPDLLMGDLLKNMRSSQIFSVCGLPEIELTKIKPKGKKEQAESKYQVKLVGLDVFDPVTMEVDHRHGDDVPAWLLDTDYNDLCFHVCQAFFPRTAAWDNLKKALKGTYDEAVGDHLAGDTSAPFPAGEQGQIAVKVIDDRGNELLVVKKLSEVKS